MKKTVFLHIGLPKTGTSLVQRGGRAFFGGPERFTARNLQDGWRAFGAANLIFLRFEWLCQAGRREFHAVSEMQVALNRERDCGLRRLASA